MEDLEANRSAETKRFYLRLFRFAGLGFSGFQPRAWLPPFGFAVFLVLLWEATVRALNLPPYLLPAPSAIGAATLENLPLLIHDSFLTLFEAALGLLLAFVISLVLAITFSRFRVVARSVMPFVVAFQAVPVIAMAPLLVLWFGNGVGGKVVMAAIICLFPMVVNLTRGLQSVSTEALALMSSLSASPWQVIRYVRIPTAVPYIFAALRISATLSVIGAIVAEFSGARQGIGFRIIISTYRTDTTLLMAALVFSVCLGLLFFSLVVLTEMLVQAKRPFNQT